MKYCEEYLPALSALVDGELNDTEREKVLTHLETCEGCRKFFAELTVMHDAMGEPEEFDVPEGFADGVMARLHEAPAAKKRSHRTAWASLAACAALVAVVLGGPLRTQRDAATAALGTAPAEPAAAMTAESAPVEEEYAEEFASVQNAPMTMMAMADNGRSVEKAASETENLAADEIAELPRSVVFVYGAAHEDYLIEEATGFDYYADGTVAGYDLPVEKLDEFLALLEADGLTYESSVAKQATTFYVQYEEAGENG